MGIRIDYFDDPAAPATTSLVPSVNVVVADEGGKVLLIRRTDNGKWALPGGAIDLGESVVQAAVRETVEETGVVCEVTGLVGIYSDPGHVIHYTSNDEVRQEFSIVLTARPISGSPRVNEEASDVGWADPAEVGRLVMDRSMRRRLSDYFQGSGWPVIG